MKFILFKSLVTIIILILVYRSVDLDRLLSTYIDIKLKYIPIALLLAYISILIRNAKWQLILITLGIKKSFLKLLHSYIIGTLFTYFTPSGAGNDIYRASQLYIDTKKPELVIGSIIIERITSITSAFIIILMSVPVLYILQLYNSMEQNNYIYLLILAIIIIIIYALLYYVIDIFNNIMPTRTSKLSCIIEKIQMTLKTFRVLLTNKAATLYVMFWGCIYYLIYCLQTYFIGLSLGINISFAYYLLFVPIITIITIIPITIQGLGLRESSFLFLFGLLGISDTGAVALGFMVYALGIISLLPILIYFLISNSIFRN